MKLSKSITGLVSAFALLGILAGCNNGGSSSSTPTDTGNTDTTPVGPSGSKPVSDEYGEAPDQVDISFWHTFGDTVESRLSQHIAEFQEKVLAHDGVTVNVDSQYKGNYDELEGVISKGFAAHNIPTIAVAYPDNVAFYMYQASEGTVINLDQWMNDPNVGFATQDWLGDNNMGKEDFIPDFIEESSMYQVEGSYSLPFMKSSEVLFYNKELFYVACALYQPDGVNTESQEAMDNWIAGLNWTEFMDFNRFIHAHASEISNTIEFPAIYDSDANLFITKLAQNGVDFSGIGENGIGTIPWESGEDRTKAEEIVQQITDAYDAGLFTTKGIEGEYGSNAFVQEQTVFSIGSSGGTGYNIPASGAFEVGVCRVPPVDEDHKMYISQGPTLTLLRNSTNDTTAYWRTYYSWELLKYLTNTEVNADMCVLGSEGYVPVRYSAYTTSIYTSFMNDVNDTYVKTSLVVQDDIIDGGQFINTAVFAGSSQLRDAADGIFSRVVNEDQAVSASLQYAIDTAKNYFHPVN